MATFRASAVGVYQIGELHARSWTVGATTSGGAMPSLRGLDRRPARRRNLEHAGIVERRNARIELGIGPHGLQFDRADAVRVRGLFDVDRVSDRRHDPGPFVGLAVTRPGDVEDFLEALTALGPALDDLDAIEIAGGRILDRPRRE